MSQALEQRFATKHEDIQVRNGNIAWWHINSEYTDVVDEVMATLAPDGPYAYTVLPSAPEAGAIPQQAVLTTRDEIHACYENLHRVIGVRGMRSVVELRNDWYTFMYGLGEAFDKATGAGGLRSDRGAVPDHGAGGHHRRAVLEPVSVR